jgi:hypothetical protein
MRMPNCKLAGCPNPVTGRQTYCTDRCRQRARKGSQAPIQRRGQNRQISLSHPIAPLAEFQPTLPISEIVALERSRPKTVPASAYQHLVLVKVNPIIWKVVDPNIKTDVPAKLGHWAGYRTTKALAWVFDLGGQWIARRGNEVCNPTNLAEAKRQALAMAVGGIGDYQVSDPIEEFQQLSASLRRNEPIDEPTDLPLYVPPAPNYLEGPTALQGDDVEREYYEDGSPKLPACLDRRRQPEPLAKAA